MIEVSNVKIGSSSKLIRGKSTMVGEILNELTRLIEHDQQLHLKSPFETAAFAYLLKEFCAKMTGEPLETFMTQEGKNKILKSSPRYCPNVMLDILKRAPLDQLEIDEEAVFGCCAALANKTDTGDFDGCSAGTILQLVGEYVRKHLHSDFWKQTVLCSNKNQFVDDSRYKNEAAAFRGSKKRFLIRLFGPRRMKTNRDEMHSSETDLDDWYDWDFVIFNFGTMEDFEVACKQVAKAIFDRLRVIDEEVSDKTGTMYFGRTFEPISFNLGVEHVIKTALDHERLATKILESESN